MLKREITRISENKLPRVPGLKESYIYRDSWTRLNVKPAKIMQVCQCLSCSMPLHGVTLNDNIIVSCLPFLIARACNG